MTDHPYNKYAETWRTLTDAENRAARDEYLQSEDYRLHTQAEREATRRMYFFLLGFLGGLGLLGTLAVISLRALFG